MRLSGPLLLVERTPVMREAICYALVFAAGFIAAWGVLPLFQKVTICDRCLGRAAARGEGKK